MVNSNLFHDKEGVFYLDWENKKIGFNGSENETYSGKRSGNFKSWVPGQKEYVDDIEEAFDLNGELWFGNGYWYRKILKNSIIERKLEPLY